MVADTLLRVHTNALLLVKLPTTVDFAAMAEAQATDPQIGSLQSSSTATLVVEAISLAISPSMGMQRPIVPMAWCRIVFDSLHGLSHPGIRAMLLN